MSIMVGSARSDERGKITGGAAGDQKQTSNSNDTKGEVSMQAMYTHSKGWYILRPKNVEYANKIAQNMIDACNNPNIGYDQNERLGVVNNGIHTTKKTESDCSSLVRQCVREATGKDPGNFTTGNEASMLEATGLFEKKVAYVSQSKTPVYNGDVLVTKTKGHTVIVVSGNPRSKTSESSPVQPVSTTSAKKVTASKSATSSLSSLAGTYASTASLNVRDGAGTAHKTLVTIPKGTKVKNFGYYTNYSGVKWLYIQFTLNNIQYTGFASSTYLKKQ